MIEENNKQSEARKSEIETEDIGIAFLENIQEKASALIQDFDVQTNIIVALSSVIFAFAISQIGTNLKFEGALSVLGFFSGLSSIFALYTIHPPKFMRKQGQEESLMYNKKITGFPSYKEYAAALGEIIGDKEKIIHQYSLETFNVYKYYYRPKRILFKISRNLLVGGAILAFVLFLIELVH